VGGDIWPTKGILYEHEMNTDERQRREYLDLIVTVQSISRNDSKNYREQVFIESLTILSDINNSELWRYYKVRHAHDKRDQKNKLV
jgi:hypothetical protein